MDPAVARCRYCHRLYMKTKLAVHEQICSARPVNMTVREAVRVVLEGYPEARRNKALLVMKVWEVRDGYITPDPVGRRLSDPWSIIREAYKAGEQRALPT